MLFRLTALIVALGDRTTGVMTRQPSNRRGGGLAVAALLLSATRSIGAQGLPSEPLVLGHGRVTLGGDVSATFSCAEVDAATSCGEDTGFFNYSDYEHSTLRTLRLALNASVRANRRISFLGEIRSDNGEWPQPYALYLRLRPWPTRPFDLQIGRVPPIFGAFARRSYASENLLIGYPLAYQYLTSLRADSLPADADELLRMRGRGWLSNFSLGNIEPARGLPLASAFRWDTGVQAHVSTTRADASIGVTNGSLGNPLVADDNDGKQITGRVAVRPTAGLALGVSATRAPYLTRDLVRAIGKESDANRWTQTAWGADAEYSRDYYLLRVETIVSQWTLPTIGPRLRAIGTMIEGRYKVRPGLFAAARLDHLGFNRISGATRTATWDAPITRVEVGGGYLLRRNLELKLTMQRNVRDGGRVPRLTLGSAQLGYWF